MNDVKFVRGKGGLGRPLSGKDHYSSLLCYSDIIPSLWQANWATLTSYQIGDVVYESTNKKFYRSLEVHSSGTFATDLTAVKWEEITDDAEYRVKPIYSIEELEDLGILEATSGYEVIWYHVDEFFRMNPQGVLYLGLYSVPSGAYDFAEITKIQDFTEGEIRQMGIYTTQNFATSQVTAIQTVLTALQAVHKPISSVIYAANIKGTNLSALSDLRALNAPNVSVVIGQDGNAKGKALYDAKAKSITCLGAVLGAVSLAKVSENIGWVEKFNLVTGDELALPAFSNGVLYRSQSSSLIDQINDKGYIFNVKHVGISGTYFNDSHTCVAVTSDYAYIENNRTIDKAIRNLRVTILPALSGPLKVNANGTLKNDTIGYFISLGDRAVDPMVSNDELSDKKILISSTQNVLSTSKLVMTAKLVPIGVAREIEINVGFTTSVTTN